MADLKISQLNAISVLTPATDVLPVVDVGGVTKKITTNQILASGGVAALASATISGNLTVDTSTLKVDSTNDCIGILTATPDADRLVNTGLVIGNGTTARGIMLYGTSSSQQNLAFSDTAATQQGLLQYDHSVDQMKFFTSGALQATLTTTALTIANGNVVMATSGKGIDFSATSSNGTSELLNDYEEGTWTPVATNLTVVGSVTYTGKYTKIGRVVYINLKVLASTSSSSVANSTEFSGLPFAPADTAPVTAANANTVASLGAGIMDTNSKLYPPTWTSVANAVLSGFYYV